MQRPVLVGLVTLVFVVFALAAGGVVLAADLTPSERTAATGAIDDDDQGFDSTTFELTVHENGDATWTSRYERQLSPGEEDDFKAFAEEFEEDDEDDLYVRFKEQAHALTDSGTASTDREMEATDFNRSAGVDYRPNRMGYVEMSFRWSGFASVDGTTVSVGDVFAGGLYIEDDQSFVVQPGDGLTFVSAQPEGQYVGSSIEDADSVSWSGQRDFPDSQPRVVLELTDASATQGITNWLLAAGVIVVGLGAGFAWYRFRETPTETGPSDDEDQLALHAEDPSEESASIADEELLTDEDRVVKLIRENGGRMKQVDIVDETGWSKSKVSMLLSDMDADGTISKLRVGRENIISLEGHEPEATRSPFED